MPHNMNVVPLGEGAINPNRASGVDPNVITLYNLGYGALTLAQERALRPAYVPGEYDIPPENQV